MLSLRWDTLHWSRKGYVGGLATLLRSCRRGRIWLIDFGFQGKPFVFKCLNHPTDKSGAAAVALVKAAVFPDLDGSVTSQMASTA
jgi:hypothetical protein